MSDEAILDLIFNPQLGAMGLDAFAPPPEQPEAVAPPIEASLLSQLRDLESRAILLASTRPAGSPPSAFDEPLQLLNQALDLCARYSSGFNNRAQMLQLAKRPLEALRDCDEAIRLASMEGAQGKTVLKQAYTQRGLIRRALAQQQQPAAADAVPAAAAGSASAAASSVAAAYPSSSANDAVWLADLERGAALGNVYAKTEAVRLNPYAALCNQYLERALQTHWSGLNLPAAAQAAQADAAAIPPDNANAGSCQSGDKQCSKESKP